MENDKEIFKMWAIVDLFGHTRMAGMVTEQEISGYGFLRVDVPDLRDLPGFTQLVGPKSVYSLTPCDEATARGVAAHVRMRPVSLYEIAPVESEPKQLQQPSKGPWQDDDDEIF